MDRFEGRVALVTGVSSGIGADITTQLVQAGLRVVGVARREERLSELAAKLNGSKGTFWPLRADLSQADEVRRVFQWIDANLGGVSVVVNNAAVLTLKAVQDLEPAAIVQLVNTNLTAVMLSCREALDSMKKHDIKDGHIVNINSVAGHTVLNFVPFSVSAYSATKHAVTALSKGLRYDIKQLPGFRTRVTSVSPGGVSTEMTPPGYVETLDHPDDILSAKDVADAVLYVLSCPQSVEVAELTLRSIGEKA